jgi:hypothetical protein
MNEYFKILLKFSLKIFFPRKINTILHINENIHYHEIFIEKE